ncbi:hypothetical protein ACHAW6_002246 [Cyclotella cf. meneghiniana]
MLARVGLFFITLFHSVFAQQDPTTGSSSSTLVQLHVINRHGARTILSKDADDLAEEGGETLTPLGYRQLYDLGVWLRQTYGQSIGLQEYDQAMHRFESSDFDRTISSANALSVGLFPLASRTDLHGGVNGLFPDGVSPSIPVYSRQSENDVYIRSFSQCPTFYDRLQDLYESNQWIELENDEQVQVLLQKLAPIFAGDIEPLDGAIPLKSLWNAYDEIHVTRTECTSDTGNGTFGDNSSMAMFTGPESYACQSLPDPSLATVLSATEFEELEDLTEKTEAWKYGIETAGNLIGSNILWQILDRATSSGGKFFLYSAHVATILGILSALQANFEADTNERFVEYGSALILEVHQEQAISSAVDASTLEQKYIKLKYKSALQNTAVDITLQQFSEDVNAEPSPCGHDKLNADVSAPVSLDSSSFCRLQGVVNWARSNTLDTVEAWCDACGNDSADQCMEVILKNEGLVVRDGDSGESTVGESRTSNDSSAPSISDEATANRAVIAATFFGGFLSGLLFTAIAHWLWVRGHKKKQKPDGKIGSEMIQKGGTDELEKEAAATRVNSSDQEWA